MKPQILQTIAALLFIGSLTTSCNSCEKKPETATAPETVTTAATPAADTTATANAAVADEATTATGSERAAKKRTTGKTGKAATAKLDKGYSAEDGTDAENYDGDQYSKNDQTPMPSGPPIK
ncbi:MAG TPA: hypothetical protein VK528_12500 [Flavobacterium sp.]|nr:hypothetical protein [Flavobacterium sp.]